MNDQNTEEARRADMSVSPDEDRKPRVIDFREVNETVAMSAVRRSPTDQRVHDHQRRTGRDRVPGQLLRWRREARRRARRVRFALAAAAVSVAAGVASLLGWLPW
jgi:hypothetical protein